MAPPMAYNLVFTSRGYSILGSGCGTVGRAVASDSRDPRFESTHLQFLLLSNVGIKTILQLRKQRKKRPGMTHLKKEYIRFPSARQTAGALV